MISGAFFLITLRIAILCNPWVGETFIKAACRIETELKACLDLLKPLPCNKIKLFLFNNFSSKYLVEVGAIVR